VLVALGIKKILAHVGDPPGQIPTVAMCGGVALYLLGHNAFRLRDVGSVPRLVATVAALALTPVAVRPRPWSPSGPRRGSWRHSRPTRRRGTGRSGANCAARPEAIRLAAATRHARPVSHGAVGQDTGEHHPGFSVR
jgi:hypothetical protein